MTYFQIYCGNPILSPYVMSYMSFRPPLIKSIHIFAQKIWLEYQVIYIDKCSIYLWSKHALSSLSMSLYSNIVSV